MKAYFRLLFAFIALGLLAAAVVGVLYVWENMIAPQRQLKAEIEEIRGRPKVSIDHGKKVYDSAVNSLRSGQLAVGVQKLHELMRIYKDSAFYAEAKRMVGEINVDRLLSRDPMQGKSEYIVERGDVLTKIARKTDTTVGYLIHVNSRMGSNLQPGDQLITAPLEFSIVVNLTDGVLTLRNADGLFFKDYVIVGNRFPSNTPSQFDSEITGLVVSTGARLIPVGTPQYIGAAKELRCKRRGVPIRALTGDADKDKYVTGIFLERGDVEELALLIRPGTKIHIRK